VVVTGRELSPALGGAALLVIAAAALASSAPRH